jgi:hypothetical protein
MPSRALLLLIVVAALDLLSTAVLHSLGFITELNPLMRPLIERSEWLFAAVKGATIVGLYLVMRWYGVANRRFVRLASLGGVVAYVCIWSVWFASGTAHNLRQQSYAPQVVDSAPGAHPL